MLRAVVNLIASAILVGGIAFVIAKLTGFRKNLPTYLGMLPSDLQKALHDAAKFGSEFVEQMDRNGELTKFLTNELKPKAQVKLNLAVEVAVKYIEGVFVKNGFPIDIDEKALEDIIQKHVWENPALFPTKQKE